MAIYILDSDIFSLWGAGDPIVRARVAAHPSANVYTTVLTVEESLVGWLTALRRAKTNDRLASIYDRMTISARALGQLQILNFSRAALDRYDQLLRLKLSVGGYDLRIAAVALEVGAIVITCNLSDFRPIPGLACEDWSV